jgi:hypothetical protein
LLWRPIINCFYRISRKCSWRLGKIWSRKHPHRFRLWSDFAHILGRAVIILIFPLKKRDIMMAEKPELFKIKVQETLRHTTAINKHTAKDVFLRLRKCFLARSFSIRCWCYGWKSHRFQVSSYVTGLWDPCVLITVLALFDGFVLRKTKFVKQM